MTRDEKIAEARRRVAAGEIPRVVAADLGVGRSTVYQWCYPERYSESRPERRAQKRAWEERMRARCAQCGGALQQGSLRADGTRRAGAGDTCSSCRTEHRVALVLEMWRLRRDEALENKQIAERLGVPPQTVATELYRLRALGYDVPCSPYNGADARPVRAAALDDSAVRLGRHLAKRGIKPESVGVR